MNKGMISLHWWSAKEIYIPKVNPLTEHNICDFFSDGTAKFGR